ncbi:MAG: NADPH:quinone reductase [Blastocatellia bacterium]|nr:NADPH:quinone reductase [Blastocatellia bacterium]
MKAIIVHEFGGPEVMRLEDVPTPAPDAGQVLVKIEAAGVNPVDTYLRSGNHAHAPALPYTPGKDGAGVVQQVGDGVTEFKAGDRVYTAGSISGTYAEFSLCEVTHLGRLPDNVTFEEGAGIWTPYATAYRALFQKAGARAGETVLIHGASGGVGIAAIQWATHAGLTVFGTASSDEGKKLVGDQGADRVIDHTDDGHLEEVRKLTDGRGVDVIIEMLANVNLQNDFDGLSMFGRITVVGNRGSLEFNPRVVMGKDATVYGMSLFNAPAKDKQEIHRAIFDGFDQGYLKPVIGESIALGDAPRAHQQVIESKAFGKIVLVP